MSPESKKSNGNICTLCYQIVKEKHASTVKCKGACKRIFHLTCARASFRPELFQTATADPKEQAVDDGAKSDSEGSKTPQAATAFTCDICTLQLAACYICKRKSGI